MGALYDALAESIACTTRLAGDAGPFIVAADLHRCLHHC
jgi:hypothetical protein